MNVKHFLWMCFLIICVGLFWGGAVYLMVHAFVGE